MGNLRSRMDKYKHISSDNITSILRLRQKIQKKETMKSKLVSIDQLKDWKIDKNLRHKSNQLFSVEGVKVKKAKREVKEWDQLIFNQPHGGVLAFLVRETKKYGRNEFLLHLRSEPGDKYKILSIVFSNKVQYESCPWWKRTELYELVIRKKGSKLTLYQLIMKKEQDFEEKK